MPFYPWARASYRGSNFCRCDRLSQGEVASGKFPWIRKKGTKELPITVPEVRSMCLGEPKVAQRITRK